MKALIAKELKLFFCSYTGMFFATVYCLSVGSILWLFEGSYNILDNGYASLDSFFNLSAALFLILIPALTMRLFAEERKTHTYDVLKTQPISPSQIYWGKLLSTFIFILVVLLSTLVYVCTVYKLSYPEGTIDMGAILVAYTSLLLLSLIIISIGLFASSVTNNLFVALLLAIIISLFAFYGFDMVAALFSDGKAQGFVSSIGINAHYRSMLKGVVDVNSIAISINYIVLFYLLFLLQTRKYRKTALYIFLAAITINIIIALLPNYRFDFTADQRYSVSDYSKNILGKLCNNSDEIKVNIYLSGKLNAGFHNLQQATTNLLDEFNRYTDHNIKYNIVAADKLTSADVVYQQMADMNMNGIYLSEVDRDGKMSKSIIYPYAQIVINNDTTTVSLLKDVQGYTAEEKLNISIENLEYEFIDALQLYTQDKERAIAFIEGHGEIGEGYMQDIEIALSRYYSINRGVIGNTVGELDQFDVVIIAGPVDKYTEQEKFILDQYIMTGGRTLWLIDGVYYSYDDLSKKGVSPTVKNETNLDDLLFTYGVRINPNIVEDKQCASIYMITDNETQPTVTVPYPYMPLLMPSSGNPITHNIRNVKATFASSLDLISTESDTEQEVLLTTSMNTKISNVPEPISLQNVQIKDSEDHIFDKQFIAVAVSLKGKFRSAYNHRMTPQNIDMYGSSMRKESESTKMIVVSSSSIISNEINPENDEPYPAGYDRVAQQQHGNREFIVNAVNWLAEDGNAISNRIQKREMYLLDKVKVSQERDSIVILNLIVPLLYILVLTGSIYGFRKWKYSRDI